MASTSNLRREVLQLYREIVRTSKAFSGQLDANGKDYATLVMSSARKEIEAASDIDSREEIYRRLVVGRDALHRIHDKVSLPQFTDRMQSSHGKTSKVTDVGDLHNVHR